MKAHYTIRLKQSKRTEQAWSFEADLPGNNPHTKNNKRYTDEHCALRGALRHIGAWKGTLVGPHSAMFRGRSYSVVVHTIRTRKRA